MNSTSIKQYRRRSSCGTIALVVAAAAMTSTRTSAFTQSNYHGSVIPRRSSTLLPASVGSSSGDEMSGGSTVLNRPFDLIKNPSEEKFLNKNKNDNHSNQEEKKKNMDDDEWELRLYDDKTNTREKVACVLVQVTGSSESDAFKTMMSAHKTGFAKVGNKFCYEVAEMYNEGLRKQGILSEIVPITSNNSSDGDSANSELVWDKAKWY